MESKEGSASGCREESKAINQQFIRSIKTTSLKPLNSKFHFENWEEEQLKLEGLTEKQRHEHYIAKVLKRFY